MPGDPATPSQICWIGVANLQDQRSNIRRLQQSVCPSGTHGIHIFNVKQTRKANRFDSMSVKNFTDIAA